ncbi:MAG TPA: histidine kinase [Solirubrobacteraceae bacterium]|nr:histidine kinase [Solirubrobacteraceae bacterium]
MNQQLASLFGAWRRQRLWDRAVVLLIALFGLATALAIRSSGVGPVVRLLAAVLTVAALLARHRRPVLVLGVILALTAATDFLPATTLPALLAVLTVTTDCEPATIAASAVATVLALLAGAVLHGRDEGVGPVISRVVEVGMAVAFGLYLRARAAYVGELRERAERVEREHDLLAIQAVADERVRIARELHDVVAHHVSLMVVQAQAAAASPAADDATRAALGRVGNLGREALSEMHRMLGVLRVGEAATAEREPQPGVADVQGLAESTRAAGIEVGLHVVGRPSPLPAAVDLSAYRIVQEALTNVVRHSGARTASVEIVYGPGRLELTVTDDGHGGLTGEPGRVGHGLVGMRERVALFGGTLSAAERQDRPGFRVHAVLPIGDAPTATTADLVSAVVRKVG